MFLTVSLKVELETWGAALRSYDKEDFETALELFSNMPQSSVILTNMGLIYATLGDHEAAVERFIKATLRNPYLAVAYFQCGVSNFLLARYDLAYRDFREALRHLRENQTIDYEQIGLKFKLHAAEVLFNQGLCLICLEQVDKGLQDLRAAKEVKVTKDHDIIDKAIRRRGRGYTVFSIPLGICYRPSEKKLANVSSRDYMGEAKLIAASDVHDTTTGFSGVERLKQIRSASTDQHRRGASVQVHSRSHPAAPLLPRSARMSDAAHHGVHVSLFSMLVPHPRIEGVQPMPMKGRS
ncbi:hypothetical protein B0H13DRAFT_2348935 [Mycena leptocephala]|nr:hypothetical protein B0H13DRAFT_2348935 [Mycena leptocephala]